MATLKRFKTSYPGVCFIKGTSAVGRRVEKIYYIRYRRDGKLVEEKVGRQYRDDMTPARASRVRSDRIEGKEASNKERRTLARKKNWAVDALKTEYFNHRTDNKSSRTDKGRYDSYLKLGFSNKEPKDIDRLSVDRLRVKLLKTKSPQTVKHVLALLKRIIKFGTDRGLCTPLPFTVKLPRVDNIKTEDLSPDQLQNLLIVLDKTKHRTASNIMKLALFTGMRRGEIFKLQWKHIDFDRGFIHIHTPKGGISQKIPLNNNARQILDGIRKSNEYLFPARGGGPRKDANKDFNSIKAEAGLPKDFRPMHGLRHVYATILATSGDIDMLTLQNLLTHKDQRMTQRYIHYHEEALQRAGNKTDEIMNGILNVTDKARAVK